MAVHRVAVPLKKDEHIFLSAEMAVGKQVHLSG